MKASPPDPEGFNVTDATALAAAITAGQISACELMESSLAACHARADLGAVVYLDEDMARDGAKVADTLPPDQRGPFHGVPFLVKDLGGFAKGLPAAAGSAAIRAQCRKPESDSHLLRRLRRAGLIPFGLTSTPPFGLSLTCEPDGMAATRNPWNPVLTPGGSSGGAAAAVAAGIVSIAHATDAAGSIRAPAACCGLTGLKPSRGAVPGGPDFANHLMGIASELVLARSVRDVKTAFDAVAQPMAPVYLPERPRVALALPERCGADQRKAAKSAADALHDAGCKVCDIHAPDQLGDEAHAIARTILAVSLAEWLTALRISDDRIPPLAATMAAEGRATPATALFAASRQLARLTNRSRKLFKSADAVLMPILSSAPPVVGTLDLSGSSPDDHMARLEAFAPNAALANVAGLPALALPFGMANGLPLGIQLIGSPGSDFALLKLGALIEARAPAIHFPHPIAGLPA
ncbi:amidase [Ruegeria arenilitoris]|uniref:amidase n=1 Tax=Ruegeria arenilitoris TaxID=1173585 RepID=UPI00147FDEA7|nr:amidase [Ruegeria arenilitoris]